MESTLTLEEFEEYFWAYIPQSLVSNENLQNNREWADAVVHDTWRLYQYSGVDKSILLKNIENTIFSFLRHRPSFS